MTLSRTNAATYLNSQFSGYASLANQAATDASATGYGPDIDNALRELDYTEAELAAAAVDETDRRAYFTLCEYFAARRLWVQVGAIPDVRLGPQSESYGKVLDAIQAIMKDASARASALGYSLDDESTWTYSQYNPDAIEPSNYWEYDS